MHNTTQTTYTGTYIEELPSTVRTITGVSTSITAFIGRALKGPVNDPRLIHSFEQFERMFGGLWIKSNMSYAVYQYFQNGGNDALIVRVHNGATKSTIDIGGAFVIEAAHEGAWSRNLEIQIEPIDQTSQEIREAIHTELAIDAPNIFTLFNLFVLVRTRPDHEPETLETFRLLSTKNLSPHFVGKVLEEESDLIRIHDPGTVQAIQPQAAAALPPLQSYEPGQLITYKVATSGDDGEQLRDQDIYSPNKPRSGILALDKADLFNLLCVPPYSDFDVNLDVYSSAVTYCEERRAIFIVDPPSNWKSADDPMKDSIGIDSNNGGFRQLRHKNAAIFFPRIKGPDPEMGNNKEREFVPCGVVAGVIARTDSQRGVWKSPAGIETALIGISDLTVKLTDAESGDLNSRGINCLRLLPSGCIVVWGVRTMRGADSLADQWKYIAVRRMALFIEESLYRGTQWAVFETNDEPLWAEIRLNVSAFMINLFYQGAFQGTTPNEAYLVKCDRETTSQDDVNRGIVNIVVGFAPLKPAEFVIVKIQQHAGKLIEDNSKKLPKFRLSSTTSYPYKNFKFRIKWDGKYIAGVSKVSALKRTTEVAEHREGDDPSTSRKIAGRTKYDPIILERGITHDMDFEKWANKVLNSGTGFGAEVSTKDVTLEVYNEVGQFTIAYKIYRCWVSEYQALPDLKANANAVLIEYIKLENEGWERDESVTAHSER
jgi:uncharacterized protein